MSGLETLDFDRLWSIAADPYAPDHLRDAAWEEVYYRQEHGERPAVQLALIAERQAWVKEQAERAERSRKSRETRERNRMIYAERNLARIEKIEQFGGMRGRRMWAYEEHKAGRSFADIGRALAIGRERAKQLVARAERELKNPRRWRTPTSRSDGSAGRPLDMGGPRDVWLEFFPSPDPRLDNMAPVVLDNSANIAA